jgi:hypothetical protein
LCTTWSTSLFLSQHWPMPRVTLKKETRFCYVLFSTCVGCQIKSVCKRHARTNK